MTIENSEQYMKTVQKKLEGQCADIGMDRAIRDYCEPLFPAWMESLKAGKDTTTLDTRLRIVAGMSTRLSIRDALIASAITDDLDMDTMLRFAAEPNDADSTRAMYSLIAAAFDGTGRSTTERKNTAIAIMQTSITRMRADDVDGRCIGHALAFVAYLQYMSGASDTALRNAREALENNRDVSLANIVQVAVIHDINPTA